MCRETVRSLMPEFCAISALLKPRTPRQLAGKVEHGGRGEFAGQCLARAQGTSRLLAPSSPGRGLCLTQTRVRLPVWLASYSPCISHVARSAP